MSWNAVRYRDPKVTARVKTSTHHVPPRSRGKALFTVEKPHVQHLAYHILFGNAGSFEECCEILKREWWTPP